MYHNRSIEGRTLVVVSILGRTVHSKRYATTVRLLHKAWHDRLDGRVTSTSRVYHRRYRTWQKERGPRYNPFLFGKGSLVARDLLLWAYPFMAWQRQQVRFDSIPSDRPAYAMEAGVWGKVPGHYLSPAVANR